MILPAWRSPKLAAIFAPSASAFWSLHPGSAPSRRVFLSRRCGAASCGQGSDVALFQLKRTVWLLLQLALLALLVLALGDRAPPRASSKGAPWSSSSMRARRCSHDVRPNRLAVAKDEVKKNDPRPGRGRPHAVAQMDAMVSPSGDVRNTSALERSRRPSRQPCARISAPLRPSFAASTGEVVVCPDGE